MKEKSFGEYLPRIPDVQTSILSEKFRDALKTAFDYMAEQHQPEFTAEVLQRQMELLKASADELMKSYPLETKRSKILTPFINRIKRENKYSLKIKAQIIAELEIKD